MNGNDPLNAGHGFPSRPLKAAAAMAFRSSHRRAKSAQSA